MNKEQLDELRRADALKLALALHTGPSWTHGLGAKELVKEAQAIHAFLCPAAPDPDFAAVEPASDPEDWVSPSTPTSWSSAPRVRLDVAHDAMNDAMNDVMRNIGWADADGWISWMGGDCPIDPNQNSLVDIRFRNGEERGCVVRAHGLRWTHSAILYGGEHDIIAYRVCKEA